MSTGNLHPIFERMLSRAEKEKKLRQRAKVIWLYGLSGSGKSTLAIGLERQLYAAGFTTELLDGDNVRTGLNRGLGFSDDDRRENIRRVAEVAKLFVQAGVVALCSFITPTRALRSQARAIIGAEDFIEIYVKASYATCASRDPKGLYAKANTGGVDQFTGRDSSFEPPEASDSAVVVETENEPAGATLKRLHALILPHIEIS
jgi:adenylylsulfate kinase